MLAEDRLAAVLCSLGALQLGLAYAALDLDLVALIQPVQPQRLFEVEFLTCLLTAFKTADKARLTLLPVLVSLVIAEHDVRAVFTVEERRIQLLHDESVNMARQADGHSAVGARVVVLLPLVEAGAAAQLVALKALAWVLNNVQADRACEVLVH